MILKYMLPLIASLIMLSQSIKLIFADPGDGNKDSDNGTELLAYMADQNSSCEDFQPSFSIQADT
jgi:hypothetical protein